MAADPYRRPAPPRGDAGPLEYYIMVGAKKYGPIVVGDVVITGWKYRVWGCRWFMLFGRGKKLYDHPSSAAHRARPS